MRALKSTTGWTFQMRATGGDFVWSDGYEMEEENNWSFAHEVDCDDVLEDGHFFGSREEVERAAATLLEDMQECAYESNTGTVEIRYVQLAVE